VEPNSKLPSLSQKISREVKTMKPAKILVVEDENIVAKDIASSLKRLGYAVSAVASSGEEAVERTVDTHPDLVLMDIVLRGKMDGVQTAQHIHDHFNIPVIYLTAYTDEKTLQRAKMTEPFGYIIKPFEERELHSTIEMALYKSKTESKLRKLEEAEENLLQSEKLRALGEMVAEVGHHFNNFLAIILLNAELLEKKLKRYRAEGIKERLRIIVWTANEGAEIVRRLQHFTQRQVSIQDFSRIDLNEIVRSVMASTSLHWKDKAEARGTTIKIKEKLGKLPLLLGSRSELMEVLTNLIFNALDAMEEGGEITIRTEAKGNEVLLYFTDTGKGIPKRIKDRIFDPFFTTKDPKASGLGLSVCYGIIKRHKGKIKVDSIKGKGTTFTISIPIPLEVSLEEGK
jgi:signal transduction histidine kinase